MKLKNISIGDFIEAKNKHGGDVGHDVLEIGKSYEVLGFNEDSDLTVIISVPNHKTFCDGFYVCHECFRKPRQNSLVERDAAKELLEVDLSSELTGSDYYYSKSVTERLENGQKLVMCFVSNVSESDAMQERHVEVITSVDTEFNDTDGYGWQYAVPINNQGEPLTASEVGL